MRFFCLYQNKDEASYADETAPYETRRNSAYVIHNLEVLGNTLLNWFNDNSIKPNPGKYHLLISGNDSSKITIGNEIISSSKCEKRLGIKIEKSWTLKNILGLCVKKQVKKLMLCLDLHDQWVLCGKDL